MVHYLTLALAAVAVLCTVVQVGFVVRLAVPAVRTRLLGPERS